MMEATLWAVLWPIITIWKPGLFRQIEAIASLIGEIIIRVIISLGSWGGIMPFFEGSFASRDPKLKLVCS